MLLRTLTVLLVRMKETWSNDMTAVCIAGQCYYKCGNYTALMMHLCCYVFFSKADLGVRPFHAGACYVDLIVLHCKAVVVFFTPTPSFHCQHLGTHEEELDDSSF